MSDIGLYIHVPLCLSKCPYCDFYSVRYSRTLAAAYSEALIKQLKTVRYRFDSVYFGGGTPSLVCGYMRDLLSCADIAENAEITAEANPCTLTDKNVSDIVSAGVNRVSLGVQSMRGGELALLGRRHSPSHVRNAFEALKNAGIKNISADIMTGLPGQDESSIFETVTQLERLGAVHISAYILKIEENTPFYEKYPNGAVSDEAAAELYLYTVSLLEERGFKQYEISNFARAGFECKHNLKYWRCEEYLGIGAGAHSFLNGKRFFERADINGYISSGGGDIIYTDENAGDREEYIMLRLRLCEGVDTRELSGLYGAEAAEELIKNASLVPNEYISIKNGRISLTAKGFPVSNAVIGKLLGY